MAHPDSVRLRARAAYVMERLPLSEAARRAGASPAAVRGWKRRAKAAGDDWDAAREAALRAQDGLGGLTDRLLRDFAALFQSTMQALRSGAHDPIDAAKAMASLSDAYAKTVRAAGCVDPRLARMDIALDVLRRLAEHVRERRPEAMGALAEALDSFGPALAEEWG